LYFSDCQTGAAAGCVGGNNANAGTQASPKRDLTGIDVNTLPAGTSLLFARGGAFNHRVQIVNPNATAAAPITFADYGSGPLPILRTVSGIGTEFGSYSDTTFDGGYTFRNLVLDGGGTGQWAMFLRGEVHDVTIENVEMRNFAIGIHSSASGRGVVNLTVRNSNIHDMTDHGMLGGAVNLVLDSNRFANNNPSGGGFEHGAYLSAGESAPVGSGRVVNNLFLNNSAPNGVCDGGNLTVHGVWDGLLVENNTITQSAATGGCYGISITAAYSSAEAFRNVVVRGNTFNNVGACGVCMSSAPGAVIERNKIYNTQATGQTGVVIPAIPPGAGDAADVGAVIRDNVICHSAPAAGSSAVRATGATESGTVYQTGAAATTGACAR
jgi:Right handed beta helix region